MGKEIKSFCAKYLANNLWFGIFATCSIVLLGVSFLLPPMGEIDPSALKGSAELFGYAALWSIVRAIDKGVDAKVKHNNTSVTIGHLSGDEIKDIEDEYTQEVEEYENGRL